MQSLKFFVINFASLFLLVSCATDIDDFWVHVVDPYEHVCYGVSVVSHQEHELPLSDCYRGVILFSKDYATIKNRYYKNCLTEKCKKSVEVLDQLFLTIDKAAAEMLGPALSN